MKDANGNIATELPSASIRIRAINRSEIIMHGYMGDSRIGGQLHLALTAPAASRMMLANSLPLETAP